MNFPAMSKAETAEALGYGDDIARMDNEHDALHIAVCEMLGVPSYSLAVADGKTLSYEQHCLANYEEQAVLAVQRLIQHHRNFGHNDG